MTLQLLEVDGTNREVQQLLQEADKCAELAGYVAPDDLGRRRRVIFFGGHPIGFFTPRREGPTWRLGALYVRPGFRKRVRGSSLAEIAIKDFLRGRQATALVEPTNLPARALLERLGFKAIGRFHIDGQEFIDFTYTGRDMPSHPMPQIDEAKLNEALKLVEDWDFSLAKKKLLEPEYAGWTPERAAAAERGYKRYLSLIRALGGYRPVPNADIDRFWHEHILDTERYRADCQRLFGYFLEHYPYFGMRGEGDKSNWEDAAAFSEQTWEAMFGEKLYRRVTPSSAGQNSPESTTFDCPSEGSNHRL